VNACYSDARILYGKEMSVDEVMAEILKERNYFVRSKGGVTFSGGEAALQADFVRECSRRCRLEYINTAIETAGAVPWEQLWHAVEYIDEVLFDIKTLEDADFKKISREPLQLVLQNLSKLCEKGKQVYLYTDDACTYQFYERRGFQRSGEKKVVLDFGSKKVPLTCFLFYKTL